MAKMVHARFDDDGHELLRRLRRRTGLSESELVRRGIEALARSTPERQGPAIVGIGAFASRKRDLGSNKKHLAGFGRR